MIDGLFSNCCGVPASESGGMSSEDLGICPECLEHCDYEGEEV